MQSFQTDLGALKALSRFYFEILCLLIFVREMLMETCDTTLVLVVVVVMFVFWRVE